MGRGFMDFLKYLNLSFLIFSSALAFGGGKIVHEERKLDEAPFQPEPAPSCSEEMHSKLLAYTSSLAVVSKLDSSAQMIKREALLKLIKEKINEIKSGSCLPPGWTKEDLCLQVCSKKNINTLEKYMKLESDKDENPPYSSMYYYEKDQVAALKGFSTDTYNLPDALPIKKVQIKTDGADVCRFEWNPLASLQLKYKSIKTENRDLNAFFSEKFLKANFHDDCIINDKKYAELTKNQSAQPAPFATAPAAPLAAAPAAPADPGTENNNNPSTSSTGEEDNNNNNEEGNKTDRGLADAAKEAAEKAKDKSKSSKLSKNFKCFT
jgi:hypothetical protein